MLSFSRGQHTKPEGYDDHFYCFGCGETGDCTGFTAKLFGLTQIEAAKKISYDFGLHLFNGEIAVPVNRVMQAENEYKARLKNATAIVDEYLNRKEIQNTQRAVHCICEDGKII